MMREILSKHDLRMLLFLEELNNYREKVSLEQLSETLKMSIRTLSNYIQEFNNLNLPLHISTSNGGVVLHIPNDTSFRYIYKAIYEQSLEFSLIQQLFIEENHSLEELALSNFVSVSTIKRALSHIRKGLKKEGILLSPIKNTLEGGEENIRQMLNFFYDEKYFGIEFMTNSESQVLRKLVVVIFEEKGVKIYQNQLQKYMRWLYINAYRVRYGHTVAVKEAKFQESKLFEDRQFVEMFQSVFALPFTPEVLNDLFYQLNNNYYFYSYEDMIEIISQTNAGLASINRIQSVLTSISIRLDAPLSDTVRELLTIDFYNILHFQNKRSFILYDRRERFTNSLTKRYPHIKNFLVPFLNDLVEVSLSRVETDELLYILLTHWYELFDQLSAFEQPTKLYLLLDTDIEHALFIKRELERYCRHNIRCIPLMDIESQKVEDTAILVTTIAATPKNIKNVVCFSDYFSDRNWEDLNRLIEKLLFTNLHA